MKRGIIFDMDGTLWDSSDNVAKSWNIAIEKSGKLKRTLTTADMKRVMGKTMDEIADLLFAELSRKERMQLLDLCCETENAYLSEHGGILYPQVEETLQVLKKNYNLYIVSNCQKGYIEAFLEYYDFGKYVDDRECYGNNLRPKGENIRLVAERNGLEQAVYVGDIQGDYVASCKAMVPFIHAAYGFGTIDAAVPAIHTFSDLQTLDVERIMCNGIVG